MISPLDVDVYLRINEMAIVWTVFLFQVKWMSKQPYFDLTSGNLLVNSLRGVWTLAALFVESIQGNSIFLAAWHVKLFSMPLPNWNWNSSNFFLKAQICSHGLFTSWLFPCSFKFNSDRYCVMSVRNSKSFNQFSSLMNSTFWCLLSISNLISCRMFLILFKVTALLNQRTAERRCTRIVWSIVSNAEETSSKASTDMLPLLRERNRSLTTFRRAVSVLWHGRYADWQVL